MTDPGQDYLAAYRRSVATPAEVRDANLKAVLERASAVDDAPTQPSRRAAALLALKVTTVAVLGTGVGWVGFRAFDTQPSRPPSAPVAITEPTEAPEPKHRPAQARTGPTVEPPTAVVAVPPEPESAQPRKPRAVASPTVDSADKLREELALLEAARAHLRAGRRTQASETLSEHARRFPQGSLAVERSAWRAIVACSGSGAQPQAAARSFILTHGDTPIAAKVKAECSL